MKFFTELMHCRLRTEERKELKKLVRRNPDIYDSESHFIRVAILREIAHRKTQMMGVKR
jgi:hypothetical protein